MPPKAGPNEQFGPPRDRRSRSPLHPLRAQSPEMGGHVCTDAETLETAALRKLLSHRREGEFVDAEGMDTRLEAMIADKRRAHGLPT